MQNIPAAISEKFHTDSQQLLNSAFIVTIYVAALAVFLKNAWVGDDAYITFRAVEQLFAGNGPNFNPHERAMVFTSPIWYWLLCAARLITSDLYAAAIGISLALWTTTLVVIHKTVQTPLAFAMVALAMMSSNGFYDYTTSGLENPAAYLAIATYAFFYFRRIQGQADAVPLLIVAGVAVLVRHDIATLLLVPTAYALWQDRHRRSFAQWAGYIAIAAAPLATWTAFSLIYYGFPFPNTMYAKTYIDLPRHLIIAQHGVQYWAATLTKDTATVLGIAAAIATAAFAPRAVRTPARVLAAGIVFNCCYVTYVGGDFMLGRFLAYSYLMSIFVVYLCCAHYNTSQPTRKRHLGVIVLMLAAVTMLNLTAHTPLNSSRQHRDVDCTYGIADERGCYFHNASIHRYLTRKPENPFPLSRATFIGVTIKDDQNQHPAYYVQALGQSGYHAGTEAVIFDAWALASPMVARMNAHPSSRIGHYNRFLHEGMATAHEAGPDAITDPAIRDYYRRMSVVTESENLFTTERIKHIILLNTTHRRLEPANGNPWDTQENKGP